MRAEEGEAWQGKHMYAAAFIAAGHFMPTAGYRRHRRVKG
jgi:hypothetical protein